MRFESFEKELANLLGLIVMFEQKIEKERRFLAGNQDFHTRLVFQELDSCRKGYFNPRDIQRVLSQYGENDLQSCQSFCRKYSTTGAISYDEFLKIIAPQTDQILSQRLLMRVAKRGAILPSYLWQQTKKLLADLIKMLHFSQKLRKIVLKSSQLSYLQIMVFFQKCLNSNKKIYDFCKRNSEHGFDFNTKDVSYLSLHVQSKNDVEHFTEEDIKEILCPLEMNFSKPVEQMATYYQTLKYEMKKTLPEEGWKTKQPKASNQTLPNFLGRTYQKLQAPSKLLPTPVEKRRQVEPKPLQSSKNMYLDKFLQPNMRQEQSERIDLDGFLLKRERFEDELENNNFESDLDQSESAFIQN